MLNLIIAAISSLAALASAIIYYFTLSAVKKQTQNSYRPQLFLDKALFLIRGVQFAETLMAFDWNGTLENFSIIKKGEIGDPWVRYNLKCFNIGFGTATNIEISYKFDLENFMKRINQLNEKLPEKEKIFITQDNTPFIHFEGNDKSSPYYRLAINTKHCLEKYISYIVPVSISNIATDIEMPEHFLNLINVYIHHLFKSEGIREETKIPELKLEIKYRDSSQETYTYKAKIETHFMMYSETSASGQYIVTPQK